MPRDAVPTVAELEARIDEAVVIARASEEGVREVGELAVDAARSARRAAEAAEESARAAAAVKAAGTDVIGPAGPVTAGDPPPAAKQQVVPPTAPPPGRGGNEQPPVRAQVEVAAAEGEELVSLDEEEQGPAEEVPAPVRFEERFRNFSERAERLSGRLRRLCEEQGSGPSVGAGRRRGDY